MEVRAATRREYVMSMMPAYAKVYSAIKNDIINGTCDIGDMLPSESDLCVRFGVSRITVRRAMELLSRDGYIEIKQGYGTTVINHSVTHNLNTVSSITETLKKKGYHVTTKQMTVEFIDPNEVLVSELRLRQGSKAVRIQRLQLADNRPIAIMKNYLVPEMVPGIEDYINKFVSLYHFLEDHYNIEIDSARDRITAKGANAREAAMLQTPEQTALINFRRICYENKVPVTVDQVYILGDFYQYEFNITGRVERDDTAPRL